MSELMDLAAVPYMVLAPRDGKPVIEVVQDTMLGSFRLTKDWVRIHDKTLANLQMVNSYFYGEMPKLHNKDHNFSGKQAFSHILPPSLYISMKNKAEEKVVIKDSQLLSGTIDKPVFHSISKGIIPILYHDYGPFEVRRFLDNLQRLVCRWLMSSGFSVGISDLVVDAATQDKLKETIHVMKANAYKKIEEARKGNLVNNSIFQNDDFFEREIINILNNTTKDIGKIGLEQIDERTNRMINMVKSGSKGKDINVSQMIGCVGQQNVDGKRVAYGFTDRTLPHFNKFDDGPEARGFVENSFISGLTPQEVFFHAMGGREGLIDTAVKTSETGYIQRRLVKAMEDCKIYYDQTVRNATGVIVQFLYGEDGMDGTKMENQYIPYIKMNMFEMDKDYYIRPEDNFQLHMTENAWKEMKEEGNVFERCKEHYDQLLDDREFLIQKVFKGDKIDKITFPIPFERIISTAVQRSEAAGTYGLPTDLTPKYVLDKLDTLVAKLKVGDIKQGTRFIQLLTRLHLSPKPLIFKHHMTRSVFDWIVDEVYRYFLQAIAQAGEMIGIVAAQTMGENSTQLVLDSFHSSGTVAAVKATSGVPRFKELLSVSKNIKTPILTIYLQRDIGTVVNPVEDGDGKITDTRFQETKERAIKVKNSLEITRLVDILDATEVFWDPPGEDGLRSGIETDDHMLEAYREFGNVETTKCRSNSPWLLRMKLNKDKMYRLGLTMLDVYLKIHSVYSNMIDCTFSDDNASELIFRVRMTEIGMKDIESEDAIAALKAVEHNLIHNVLLKGVKGIKKVSMHPKSSTLYNAETANFEKVSEWVLDTDGSNLQEIFANPNVDNYRTRSNDVWEIFHTLGIEAARNALYHEIMDVIGEGALNYRHVSLLLDTMTNRGTLMSIDRHGINRGDVGPLAKSSFEETTDMLINASIFSEYDKINGVSANIMLGQLPPCGTGDSEIILDEDKYIQLLRNVSKKEALLEGSDYAPETPEVSDPCGYNHIAFQYELPTKQNKTIPKAKVTFV
jgi:DNA-directed RNA polymerase II subunit RPB1